jgi:uncharacterized protein (TIGR02145 family)
MGNAQRIGWRVPTDAEIEALLDNIKVSNEWVTENNVSGRRFTDNATGNVLFFPAVGVLESYDGTLLYAGEAGIYWSCMPPEYPEMGIWCLDVNGDGTGRYDYDGNNGLSVRCVAE